jgi:hypothetical protein
MEEIKAPKKERKFLKAIGNIGKVLAEELVMGIARKFIGKVVDKVKFPKKRETLSLLLLISCSIAFAQFPSTGNKQRLGFQTTADGLVWRGSISDTASIQPVSNQNAWVILDTVNLKIYSFDFTSNIWNQVGGGAFAQPIDSLFFNVNVPTNNVDTAKMRWDSDLATVVLGLNDNVPNEIGFKNFWLVKNQTGLTITKGSLVYANGTVGASGRITVAKFIANGSIDAKYLLGITAHDLTDGEDGYVISFGKIRQVNTDTFAAGTILYPSPTTAGVWTDIEPIAPNLDMPIGFCINSHVNNGTIAIRVASGYKLSELHDLAISSPVTNASLYYSGGLWIDTTATLLVSDTASMLANYATKAYADTSGRFYARQDFTNVSSSTLTWTQSDTLVVGGVNVVQVYRNGQILLPTQYTIPTNASVVIGATAYKVGENYTVIFPRGGGGGGSGSGSLTSISGGTGIIVNPNPITTTGTVSADLSILMELTDTTLLNLTTRFATKQKNITLTTTGTSGASTLIGDTLNIPQYSGGGGGSGTVTSVGSGYGILGGPITTTGTLRVDSSTVYDFVRDSIVAVEIGGDTIKIIKQEYTPATSDTLTFTILPKFPIQLRQFILLFRNGQLLLNDQFTVIDTNKVKIAATSYKVGENYTLVTVSGIGSVSSAQSNPIYPEAGIALSTGTTWTTSITNNSSNWNTAFTDRLKWDGGSTGLVASTGRTSLGGTTIGQSMFTLTNPSAITFPRFNADNTVSALSATDFRTAIGAGVGSGNGTVTSVTVSATSGNPLSISNTTTTPVIELLSATSGRNGYLTSTDWNTFNNKGSGNISGNGSNLYFPIFTSSSYISQSLLRWDGSTIPNAKLISDYNINEFNGTLLATGATTLSSLIGTGTRMVVASETGLLSTQTIGTSVTSFSAGTTGFTPNTASTGVVTLAGTLALTNGGTGGTSASTARTGLGATVRGANVFTLPDIDQVSFIRYNANNTVSQRTAEGIRIDLGGTTIGQSMFMLTNPSAITFPRFNADNTVSALDAASFRTAIGVGAGGVTSVTASTPLSSSGGATPNITITDAGTGASGVVNTTTQSFAGNKTFTGTLNVSSTGTFGGRVNTPWLERQYTSSTSSSFTVSVNTTWLDINTNVLTTLTLPNAATYPGKELHIRQTGTGQVQSLNSNVIPFTSPPTGSAGTAIFNPTNNKAVTLVSDGANWIIMQRSTN